MQTSSSARALLRQLEGCKLKAYFDCVGVLTIGVGHTAAAGAPKPFPGMTITDEEADQILSMDLRKFEAGVMKVLRRTPTQNQFDAMVLCAFNIGLGAFQRSSIVSRFNRGDIDGAAAAFLMWNKAGGRVIDGLTRRRRAEMKLFSTGDMGAARLKFGVLSDPVDMPSVVDAPEPPKGLATSKTTWAAVTTGAGGIGGVISAAQPLLDTAQTAKDAAGQASGLLGIDGHLALLIGLAIVIVVGCGFIIWDRRSKLVKDGV